MKFIICIWISHHPHPYHHTVHVHSCVRPQTSLTIGAADQSVHKTLPCHDSLEGHVPHTPTEQQMFFN